MTSNFFKSNRWAIMFFLLVLFLDQLSKHLAETMLPFGSPIVVIPKFFNLTRVHNPGAAFGMFAGLPEPTRYVVLTLVSTVALLILLWFMKHEAKDDPFSQVMLAGILGGALGNIIDRVRFGAVVDFLDFYIGTYHWHTFNIADSAISCGVFVVLLRVVFQKNPGGAAKRHEAQSSGAASER